MRVCHSEPGEESRFADFRNEVLLPDSKSLSLSLSLLHGLQSLTQIDSNEII